MTSKTGPTPASKTLPVIFDPNDVVVVNNSRVIPARLTGQREETGGQVEIFLVREIEAGVWEALVRPGARLKKGARAVFGNGRLIAEMLDEPGAELRQVRFHSEGSFDDVLAEVGSTPLPPYIKRPAGVSAEDRERYQTVYSQTSRRDCSSDSGPPLHARSARGSRSRRIDSQRSRYTLDTERLNLFASTTWTSIQSAANTSRSPTPRREQSIMRAQTVEGSSSLGPLPCERSNRLRQKTEEL